MYHRSCFSSLLLKKFSLSPIPFIYARIYCTNCTENIYTWCTLRIYQRQNENLDLVIIYGRCCWEGQKGDQEGKRKRVKYIALLHFDQKVISPRKKCLVLSCLLLFQHCFICRPLRFNRVGGCWDRTVVTLALAVRSSGHLARSRIQNWFHCPAGL